MKVKSLRDALNELLASEHTTPDGDKGSGSELIALAIYNQATDPASPHWAKSVDMIAKLTNERERLAAAALQLELMERTEPKQAAYDVFKDDDTGELLKLRQSIRESLLR